MSLANYWCTHDVAKRVRARDLISMNRSLVGIPFLGARNPHCPEYPLIHEIVVGIPSSGDSVQWGFLPVVILGGNLINVLYSVMYVEVYMYYIV